MKLQPLNKPAKLKRGLVYLWTGTGEGKTTAALGMALRAVGHGQKVVVIQWMKAWKNTGEHKVQRRLRPNYELHMFGRYGKIKGWVSLKGPADVDKRLAHDALEFAKQVVKKKRPHLLVLDEINLACHIGLLDTQEVIAFLDTVPAKTTVYLTGRFAPKALIDRADSVTEVRQLKHPMGKGIQARRGIEYMFW
jgi:cob(I)alamin adenosyltransferase